MEELGGRLRNEKTTVEKIRVVEGYPSHKGHEVMSRYNYNMVKAYSKQLATNEVVEFVPDEEIRMIVQVAWNSIWKSGIGHNC